MTSIETAPKKIAILQSNYLPWKGYFDLIRAVDLFIILDDVQYTKNDWRNRNRIKTQAGVHWLTLPVVTAQKLHQTIDQTRIARPWARAHWLTVQQSYARARHFERYGPGVSLLFDQVADEPMLSRINAILLRGICSMLGINVPFAWSRDVPSEGRKGDRVLSLCRAAGATHYLSGPAAKSYLDLDEFRAAGIAVTFANYAGYPEYPQLHGQFEHAVSILDLLFNVGPDALTYMKPLLG
jgi:WbqC-like protein family